MMKNLSHQALSWLSLHAAPVWSTAGVDRLHGGFYDSLAFDLAPVAAPKRCRTIARQIVSFAELARLGLPGPWLGLVASGCEFLLQRYRKVNGEFRSSVTVEGGVLDDGCSNYELAFVLLALASAARVLQRPDLESIAFEVLDFMNTRAHPEGGYREAVGMSEPLLANPHMHLFEAALAWREVSNEPRWVSMSDALSGLCLTRMVDADTGTLSEHFDRDWRPLPPDAPVVEPGHQFEWAWLLLRWSDLSGVDTMAVAQRLCLFAQRHGIDRDRNVAIGCVLPDGSVTNATARLWAQTEWLKAMLVLARRAPQFERKPLEDEAQLAWDALARFLNTPIKGVWYDVMTADGALITEPARATSFYHIIGAIAVLADYGA